MPYKDPAKMAEYMRQRRAEKSGKVNKVNVNPSVNRKPVNPNFKTSQVVGSYEKGLWMGICPVCNFHNKMDPTRSYRPADKCDHFQKLLKPGTASEFLFLKGNRQRVNPLTQNVNPVNPNPKSVNLVNLNKTRKDEENQVNINPSVNPVNRKPVNPVNEKYLLSYSRNKYQFVLYSVDFTGRKSLIRSCKKNDVLKLGPCEIVLTWGPDIEEVQE